MGALTRRKEGPWPTFFVHVTFMVLIGLGVVDAYSRRAGTCEAGRSLGRASGYLHGPNGQGELSDGNLSVRIGNVALTANAETTVAADTELRLDVTGQQWFKGFLLRLGPKDNSGVDASQTLQVADGDLSSFKLPSDGEVNGPFSSCATNAAGICHSSPEWKSSVSTIFHYASRQDADLTLDVTVVISNAGTGRDTWHFSTFDIAVRYDQQVPQTANPTSLPTLAPTFLPTSLPTRNPTSLPTKPTSTLQPTSLPTRNPLSLPTAQPTHFPTSQPTHFPTSQPTYFPTSQPTHFPTSQPTDFPATQPTDFPATQPTFPPNPPTLTPAVDCVNGPMNLKIDFSVADGKPLQGGEFLPATFEVGGGIRMDVGQGGGRVYNAKTMTSTPDLGNFPFVETLLTGVSAPNITITSTWGDVTLQGMRFLNVNYFNAKLHLYGPSGELIQSMSVPSMTVGGQKFLEVQQSNVASMVIENFRAYSGLDDINLLVPCHSPSPPPPSAQPTACRQEAYKLDFSDMPVGPLQNFVWTAKGGVSLEGGGSIYDVSENTEPDLSNFPFLGRIWTDLPPTFRLTSHWGPATLMGLRLMNLNYSSAQMSLYDKDLHLLQSISLPSMTSGGQKYLAVQQDNVHSIVFENWQTFVGIDDIELLVPCQAPPMTCTASTTERKYNFDSMLPGPLPQDGPVWLDSHLFLSGGGTIFNVVASRTDRPNLSNFPFVRHILWTSQGETLRFQARPGTVMKVHGMRFIDVSYGTAKVLFYAPSGNLLQGVQVPSMTTGGQKFMSMQVENVSFFVLGGLKTFSAVDDVTVTFSCVDKNPPACEPAMAVIDFETDKEGNALAPGTLVAQQNIVFPLDIQFDARRWEAPSTGGFNAGMIVSSPAQDNALMITQDWKVEAPNDNRWGGILRALFPKPTTILSFNVRNANQGAVLELYDAAQSLVHFQSIPPSLAVQTIALGNSGDGIENVRLLTLTVQGSGALDNLKVAVPMDDCEPPSPPSPTPAS